MISVQEARAIIRKHLLPRQVVRISLSNAMGHVIAQDMQAPEPSPRFTNSAMDGFAVRWMDVQSTTTEPVVLKIIGESQAGIPFQGMMNKGEAVRISTGAMLPEGADTVVPIEEAEVDKNNVRILSVKQKAQHVRFRGEEFQEGELLLPAGTVIKSPQVALLASMGIVDVPVYRPPKVAIVVTGTEVMPFDRPIRPWEIRDSNRLMLATAVEESGGVTVLTERAPDHLKKTEEILELAASRADLILFSGGVSVGEHDHVKQAAQNRGFEPLFWKVRVKPGKPLYFARRKDVLLFGLPGNPVSAFMCYVYFIHPVIRYLRGRTFALKRMTGKLASPIKNSLNRDHFLRVHLELKSSTDLPPVYPLQKQGSHMITTISNADGFIHIAARQALVSGTIVEVILFHET